jgi:uncharacterized protein (UPF0303 family)
MKTDIEQLEDVIAQEEVLHFTTLDTLTVTNIARNLAEKFRSQESPSYITAVVNGNTLYAECLPGAGLDNAEWARRKGNTATLLFKSSYRVTLELRIHGKDLSNRGVPVSEYALSGGAFPIKLGDLTVGYFAASGTTQEEEHQIIAETIAEYLGEKIPSIFD